MSIKYAQYHATAQMKLHKTNLYHNRSVRPIDMECFCRKQQREREREKITSLITKGACVWYETVRNRTNWLFSDLNFGLNSTHDE